MDKNYSRILLTFFYTGYLPAPGTFASLFTMLLLLWFPFDLILRFLFFLLICFVGFYLCYKYSQRPTLGEDPGVIVIDEVVGMGVCILFIEPNFSLYFICFLLFRFLDILKPSFIYDSQFCSNGVGIMLDDIICGLLVMVVMGAALYL